MEEPIIKFARRITDEIEKFLFYLHLPMIKKLIFIIFLFFTFSFLSFLMSDKAFAASDTKEICVDRDSFICKLILGSPPDKCCRENGCSSVCGLLDKWNFCYITGCCAESYGSGGYYGFYWQWLKKVCSVGDTCRSGEEYLRPGICDDTGCTVGGIYKACCSKVAL